MPDQPTLTLTVTEIATERRVSRETVLNWIYRGRLPASRIGGSKKWLVTRADLDAMTEKSR